MHSVNQILSRKSTPLISVAPQTPVFEALKIMSEKNIGSVIVMEDDQYVGIITERDYARKVILKDRQSMDTIVSEIMSTDLPRLAPSSTLDECMEIMSATNVRYLPIFNNDDLVGIISMSDIVKQIILVQKETINNLNTYLYSQ